jgi:excinuclease ABC subunit A
MSLSPGVNAAKVLEELARQGFSRVIIDGRMTDLAGEIALGLSRARRIDLVIDRVVMREGIQKRLAEAVEVASRHGEQIIKVHILPAGGVQPAREMVFSHKFVCLNCGAVAPEITPSLFSFNNPQGACPRCHGLGQIAESGKRLKDSASRTCPDCGGARLRKESRAARIAGSDISQIAGWPAATTLEFFHEIRFSEDQTIVGKKIVGEIVRRLCVLRDLGLDYLSLSRSSVTLSGGEMQRVRLATELGSGMAGVL